MADHFSSIGVDVETEEAFIELIERTAGKARSFDVEGGAYLRCLLGAGSELWVQVDSENAIIGANPHFAGKARMRVGLTARVNRPGDTALDGAFHGWADPPGPNVEDSVTYPFVFDAPDFSLHRGLPLPAVVEVQIAAFAHELTAFASEEDYLASQTGEMKFAAESFIPSGLFSPTGEDTDPPQAYAIFSGRVLDTAVLTNTATGAPFRWAHVRTLGGEVDVVADPQTPEGPLVTGGIVTGSFWLSGRIPAPGQDD